MMNIPPVFNHLLDTDVTRQKPFDMLLACQLGIACYLSKFRAEIIWI